MSETQHKERCLEFDDSSLARELFGPGNDNLTMLSGMSGLALENRGTKLFLGKGDDQVRDRMANLLIQMYGLLKAGRPIYASDIKYGWKLLGREPGADLRAIFHESVFVASPKRTVTPKTLSQKEYVQAVRDNDMTFAIGPAGTGKTYLAVAMAVAALTKREVKRLILTRPAVEAGEKLGYLPGDLADKVNPYLRPLYDALHDLLDPKKVSEMIETGTIEIAPLAFMRGRTLNGSFIILDEAQNTTPEQMKMFLTRLGFGSRAVITGDVTQIDLPTFPNGSGMGRSGLVQAERILAGVPGLKFLHFHDEDVIRHPLVGRIVKAYERQAQEDQESY